jgi:electron transport complex protein RnfG
MSGADSSAPMAAPEMPEPTSALRMILTLGLAGALAGLLIVLVFDATFETIEAHKAEVVRRAVTGVLKNPARYEMHLLGEPESAGGQQKVYVGFDGEGDATGVAVEAAEAGFQDVIALIYGFDPRTGKLMGMKVLESKETPGLGDKIEKDLVFVGQFDGARPPLSAVKRRTGAPGEIDAISGATISSRAVARIINHSLERVRSPIEARFGEAAR